jgi:hypothetical protein
MRSVEVFGGVFRNLWVIPAAVVAGGKGLTYVRFVCHLPVYTRNQFVLAGAIFVSATVGMEMAGAPFCVTVSPEAPLITTAVRA